LRFNADGSPKIGTNGRAVYSTILAWRDRDLADRFGAALIELLLAQHPDALGGLV
jgi:hypothetical protein